MSDLQDCGCPCPTVAPVNIPGTPGATGSAGASALSSLTANFSGSTIGSTVTANVAIGGVYAPGEYLLILNQNFGLQFTGYFQVLNIFGATLNLICLNNSTGVTFLSGQPVLPIGNPGINAFSTVASTFTIPSIGSTVSISVDNNLCFNIGEYAIGYSTSGSGPANFLITAITGTTGITLQFLGNPGDVAPGNTIPASSRIVATGAIGINAFTTLTAQITIPAIGSTVTAPVANSAWMTTGAVVVMPGPAHFQVTTISSSTSVVLTFLGYLGDLAPANTIANSSVIAPSGTQPFGSNLSQTSYASGTAYTLTALNAQVVFGTTSPQITLPAAGTWIILAKATLSTGGVASGGILNINLQRTNNTPGAVPNSTSTVNFLGTTTAYFDIPVELPIGIYQTNTVGDVLQLFAQQASMVTAFSKITAASLAAYRIA